MTDITVLSLTATGNGSVFKMTSAENFVQVYNAASSGSTPGSYTDFSGTVRLQRSPDGSTNWYYADTTNITATQSFQDLPTNQYFRFQVTAYTSGTITVVINGGALTE